MDKKIKYSIFKNFSSLIIAQAVYKILTFVMMIIMARFLGAERFGQLSYGLSFVWIFLFLSDFGLAELFIRNVSHDNRQMKKYINNTITLKIFLSSLVYLLLLVIASRFSFSMEKFWIIAILGAGVILDSFVYYFRTPFRVRESMEYEGLLMVIEAVLKLIVILLAINLKLNITAVILISLAILFVSIVNFAINFAAFTLIYRDFRFAYEKQFWVYLIKNAFPFMLIYILSFLNFRVDTIMLSLMKGDRAAGLFSADFKLLEQFILIPVTLSAVYLPLFSKSSTNAENIHSIFKRTIFTLLLLAAGIIAMFYFFAKNIIPLVYGQDFQSASNYIFIFSLVLIPFFVKPIIEKVFYALDRQSVVCFIYIFGILANILLNLILIPRYGINGASFSTFICESLMVVLCATIYLRFYLKNNFKYKYAEIERTFAEKEILY